MPNIPEVGLPIYEELVLEDHDYSVEKTNIENNFKETEESDKASDTIEYIKEQQNNCRVKPPIKIKSQSTPRSTNRVTSQSAANRAATELVMVTEEKNKIKANYYKEKLKIMQEALEIQRQNLQIQEKISNGIEQFLLTNSLKG